MSFLFVVVVVFHKISITNRDLSHQAQLLRMTNQGVLRTGNRTLQPHESSGKIAIETIRKWKKRRKERLLGN